MKLNELKATPGARQKPYRKGRGHGSGNGKTAGRGHKGQKARSGGGVRPQFEGGQMPIHMRLPKLKGFRNPARVEYIVVNLVDLVRCLPKGGDVSLEDMQKAGLVKSHEIVKVLADGDIDVAMNVSAHKFSGAAKEKIEAAGGSVTVVEA